jgi:hypothetical protein
MAQVASCTSWHLKSWSLTFNLLTRFWMGSLHSSNNTLWANSIIRATFGHLWTRSVFPFTFPLLQMLHYVLFNEASVTTVPRFGVGDGTGRRKCIVGGYAPLGVITLSGYYKQHNTQFFSLLLWFCGELKGNDYESNSGRENAIYRWLWMQDSINGRWTIIKWKPIV